MATSNRLLWAAAHVERAALADDLELIGDAQWSSPSLCGQWDVEEVLAHLTAAASVGRFRWLVSVFGAKFNFDLHNDRRLAEHLGSTPADTLRRFRAVTTSTTSTFGPTAAWLGEVVVHSEDIRRPLGIDRVIPMEIVTTVANFYAKTSFTVDSKANIAGLRLEATDGPFAAGSGPLVTGTTIALTMAMAGRGVYCHELSGPGAPILESRCLASRAGETI
ncbi:maleylpyruvate isomerase family mycothiol-dependent enzyme [Arthrobacter sp. TWP1-1]|uniref:maleylpyruvate isomerase family mycothiol-dependent enzyme n=1 Tax=Arthrobacter sp. TWP1-1 TaxID=2804568 RepID=UPI003CE8571A